MKGWLFTKAFVEPKLIEKEDPKAIPGEVVIDIKACGLCHSDVGFLESQEMADAYVTAAPCIFGHECAGIVSLVGEGVTSLKVGDRVGVVPQSPKNPYEIIGCTRDGGYATKIAVPEDQCLILPENVSFVQGAVGTDAGATSYHALFVVGLGQSGGKVGFMIDDLVSRGIQIKGSFGNTWQDVKGVYEYFATGKLNPQLSVIRFEEIGEGLELLKKGGVKGRLAATVD